MTPLFALLLFPLACAADEDHDGVGVPEDCDDTDAAVSPNARERCNGRDDDCDGHVDEPGASGATTWYRDADGDGQSTPGAEAKTACAAPEGFGATKSGDCDDADPRVWSGAPEEPNGHDDDCDGHVDEDPIDEGLVFVTEIDRQPRFGHDSLVAEGQWFEVRNAGWRPVSLAGAWLVRKNADVGTDSFEVDPHAAPTIPPGGQVVFCKTDLRTVPEAAGTRLPCDYVIGDPTHDEHWSSRYHDNTFNLQRDADTLALYVDGNAHTGRLVDRVTWTLEDGAWPREAARTMVLDPSATQAVDNDQASAWCVAANDGPRWWARGAAVELGSPGAANPACPAAATR